MEALACTIQDTVKPSNAQQDLASIRNYMGNSQLGSDWLNLVKEYQNAQDPSYRDLEIPLSSIVYYFRAKYGNDSVPRLMTIASQGTDMEDALQKVFGKGVRSLEKDWEDYFRLRGSRH